MDAKSQNRISGSILDRIDIHIEVPRVPIAKLASLNSGETSAAIREWVEAARYAKRGKPQVLVNGDMGPAEVQAYCGLDEAVQCRLRGIV